MELKSVIESKDIDFEMIKKSTIVHLFASKLI